VTIQHTTKTLNRVVLRYSASTAWYPVNRDDRFDPSDKFILRLQSAVIFPPRMCPARLAAGIHIDARFSLSCTPSLSTQVLDGPPQSTQEFVSFFLDAGNSWTVGDTVAVDTHALRLNPEVLRYLRLQVWSPVNTRPRHRAPNTSYTFWTRHQVLSAFYACDARAATAG
jgi:hypothetical protein